MKAQSAGRPGETRGWQAVLQRGIDTAAEFSDLVTQRLGAAAGGVLATDKIPSPKHS